MRIKSIIAALLLLTVPAYAQKTKSALQAEITSSFPNQITGAITPAIIRGVFSDLVNSWQQYVGVNAQVGTSYAFQSSDYGQIVTFTNSGAMTGTLPTPGGSFLPFNVYVTNNGSGTLTLSATGGTISGNATLLLAPNATYWFFADGSGTNYIALSLGSSVAASVAVGTTTVIGGTTAYLLYNNAGVLGNELYVPLANGGMGGSQAASTANQVPVFPGSSGAAVPTTITPAIIGSLGSGVATALGVNTGSGGAFSRLIAGGSTALATGAISSATCTTAQTATATGTLTTDAIIASFNGDPTAATGYVPRTSGMLTIIDYPTADTVNFKVCNNTASPITPGAITLNWRVVR